MKPILDDALANVIKPIVEGQIRSYLSDHPEIAEAYSAKRPEWKSKTQALTDSLAKRIVRDLLCAETRVRLVGAILQGYQWGSVEKAADGSK